MATSQRPFAASLVSALALALLSAAPAASLTIDDFESGDFLLTDDSTTPGASLAEVSGLPGSSVAGGVRYVRQRVTTTDALLPATSTAVLVTTPGDDAVALSSVGLDLNVDTEFIYDGIANNDIDGVGGTLGLDLSALNYLRIIATAPTVDATVTVTLWSSVTARTSSIVPLVDGETLIDLDGFTLDLSDIQAIRVAIAGMSDGEAVNISSFAAVIPEPTTGLLLATGLAGLAIRRRRGSR